MTNAIYVEGQAVLPQARTAVVVNLVWVDGQAGPLPFGQPTISPSAPVFYRRF